MLLEMVAGRPPFVAEGVGELFAKHMLEEPPPVTSSRPTSRPHMAAAIMKALAKEPDARFPTMEEFRKALMGEIKVAAGRRSARPRPPPRRHASTAGADDVGQGVDHAVVGQLRDRRSAVRSAGARKRGSSGVGGAAAAWGSRSC